MRAARLLRICTGYGVSRSNGAMPNYLTAGLNAAMRQIFLGFRLTDQTMTMRELVESLIMINGRDLAPQRESEQEIWNRLVRVFVRQVNVRPEEVVPNASITRDLGID